MLGSFNLIAEQSLDDTSTPHDFLERLLEKELIQKEDNRIQRWIQQARFPTLKTLEGFDFPFQPSINKKHIYDLASCRFIESTENVIFLGPPGVGKTHLSIALGLEAINKGFEVKFLTLENFINAVEKLINNQQAPQRLLSSLLGPDLLILDEVDIYQTDINASNLLFEILYKRHERNSTVFTSNKPFSEWNKLFGSQTRAEMILDRITHHAHIVSIEGDSYRLKDKLEKLNKKES